MVIIIILYRSQAEDPVGGDVGLTVIELDINPIFFTIKIFSDCHSDSTKIIET